MEEFSGSILTFKYICQLTFIFNGWRKCFKSCSEKLWRYLAMSASSYCCSSWLIFRAGVERCGGVRRLDTGLTLIRWAVISSPATSGEHASLIIIIMTITTKDNTSDKLEEEDLINYAKVVMLGAAGVGKTSIIKVRIKRKLIELCLYYSNLRLITFQRFVSNNFSCEHVPTVRRCDYYPSLVYDCSIVEVFNDFFF